MLLRESGVKKIHVLAPCVRTCERFGLALVQHNEPVGNAADRLLPGERLGIVKREFGRRIDREASGIR